MEQKDNTVIEPVIINFGEAYVEHLKGLASAECPDLEIIISNEILKVHKIILASRNDVFKAMLDSQMIESKKNCIEITDCDPSAFKVFLAHLYTSQVAPEHISLDLLMIAEKYLDDSLKQRCFEKLGNEISMENLIETVQVATQFNFEELITACQKFIIENFKKLIGTPELAIILKNEILISEVLKGLCSI